MYKLSIQVFVILIMVIVLNSCASIKIGTHYDKKYYFKGYKTFSWISKEPIFIDKDETHRTNPLTIKKIVQSIQSELASKGYQYIDDINQADFGLTYTVGSREKFTMTSLPLVYRNDWHWYWQGNYHDVNQWHVQNRTEGTLTIDIFDNNSKEPIWHGWATKTVSRSDRKDPTEAIKKATRKIFNDFPSIAKSK